MRPHTNVRPLFGRALSGEVPENWVAVAAALNVRMAVCRVSQRELAERSGISVATLRILQRGTGSRRAYNSTLAAVSRALGWPDDHLMALLAEPADTPGDSAGPPAGGVPSAASASPEALAEVLRVLRRIDQNLATIARHLTRPAPTR
ncbi:helix-turn-helix transcriptional regulator [Pseudofrankia sp. BMG5.37]|uniref:helix-turn-helix domain-containing protein n=1 Tax=Pseudofrankia sp. BMG5.37 TaxID=3050035 RepID=UPI00289560FE|nr:helix-turn-helix transcriptional regulator [Pseudofrankia sp. BMG5.37]MDT3444470.1 helix-turn-helix transcriptional regulator [Pseudofrankia sp. BMG5.37]